MNSTRLKQDTRFDIPILFIIFNRPDTTYRVFSQIKKIRPKYLYVVSDGPRLNVEDDKNKVFLSRKIIEEIDWDCIVMKNYSNTNLGCRERVASGINWFFENVEMGIILEDDCLPDLTFFNFCAELLAKYKDNERIMMISGDNSQDGIVRNKYSYYFSKYAHIWGWATWRRSWLQYDIDMKKFPEFKNNRQIIKISKNKKIQRYWIRQFNLFFRFKANSWDTQWTFTLFQNEGLCVIPNHNLISNIGFRHDATHSIMEDHPDSNKKTFRIKSILHPPYVKIDEAADKYEDDKLLKVIKEESRERFSYIYIKYKFLARFPNFHTKLKIIKKNLEFCLQII